jgi:cholest-4-en-3-one 26-monooxygenase
VAVDDIDLLDPDLFVTGGHHEAFRRLRAEDPLHWHPEPDRPGFWCVTKHADLVQVNRDAHTYSSMRGGTHIWDEAGTEGMLIDADPPEHTRYRLLVNKGFTPRMVGRLEDALRDRATRIIDHVVERGAADLVVDIAAELPLQAIAEIIGVPQEDRHKLFEWSNRMIGIDDPEYAGDDANSAATELFLYVDELAEQRRVAPRDDIATKLINAEIDGDRLTQHEFDMFMVLLAVAGAETTRNATTHGVHALLTHPEQLHALRNAPDALMSTAVEEILRWASPVHYFRRTATVDTELRGKVVRAGDKVVMWHASANRDEDVWADPFTFDITRNPNPHVTFGGGGPHFCLGANLARLELRVIFGELFERLPDLALAGEPVRLRSNFLAGVKHLPVTWTPAARVHPSDGAPPVVHADR